jgi:hypothetical protein
MRIQHHLFFGGIPAVGAALDALGIAYSREHIVLDICEDDDRWPDVARLARAHDAVDTCKTLFTEQELRAAAWLEVSPSWHHGYPLPDNDFGYLQETYDLSEYCESCGVGAVQIAPFRLRGEPKWGRRGILQLNWVFDEYFVTPEVWKAVFAPFGIDCRPALSHRTGEELATVVQLTVPHVLEHGLDVKDHACEVCARCNRRKYLPFTRGMFPAMTRPCEYHMVHTNEWFGSGASGWRVVLISQTLYARIAEAKLRGADYAAVAGP